MLRRRADHFVDDDAAEILAQREGIEIGAVRRNAICPLLVPERGQGFQLRTPEIQAGIWPEPAIDQKPVHRYPLGTDYMKELGNRRFFRTQPKRHSAVVSPPGFEPGTHRLKIACSTSR